MRQKSNIGMSEGSQLQIVNCGPPIVRPVTFAPTQRPSHRTRTPAPTLVEQGTTSPTLNFVKPTTASPSSSPSSNYGVYYIQSDLSLGDEYWCLCANNNSLNPGVIIASAKCRNWNSFKWKIDYEGKIRNYKNPDLCVNMKGERVTIEFCIDGKPQQMWIYNSNGRRILSRVNGYKALIVDNGQDRSMHQVKALNYNHDVDLSE